MPPKDNKKRVGVGDSGGGEAKRKKENNLEGSNASAKAPVSSNKGTSAAASSSSTAKNAKPNSKKPESSSSTSSSSSSSKENSGSSSNSSSSSSSVIKSESAGLAVAGKDKKVVMKAKAKKETLLPTSDDEKEADDKKKQAAGDNKKKMTKATTQKMEDWEKVRMIRKNHEVAFREKTPDDAAKPILVADWVVDPEGRKRVKSAVGWTPIPISDPNGSTDELLDELPEVLFKKFDRDGISDHQAECMLQELKKLPTPLHFCAANKDSVDHQKKRAKNFWQEFRLEKGDIVIVQGSSKDGKNFGGNDDGIAICMVHSFGNKVYEGRARVGQGGSAQCGKQGDSDSTDFKENKYYLHMEVFKTYTKGSCAFQDGTKAVVVGTNNNVSCSDFKKKVWDELTEEQKSKVLQHYDARTRDVAASGAASRFPRRRAAAPREAPLYNAEAVYEVVDFEQPETPTFATLLAHLKKRSLPRSSRANVSSQYADWKRFGYVKGGLAELARSKQEVTPAEDFEEQLKCPWVRELWRQCCMLAQDATARGVLGEAIYFSAGGFGLDNVTSWHADEGNDPQTLNFQFCLGDYGCDLEYAKHPTCNAGRVILYGTEGQMVGDAVETIRGPDGTPAKCILRPCREKWICFKPHRKHRTEPHTKGKRYTITLFSHAPPNDVSQKKELIKLMRKYNTPVPPNWEK
ncbi:unnamed protein product [Amoebophrya sp. A120]|nr:unnamed protein product [Amoebophrya sp. A120]|eukprot:GSA120T00002183001.1